MSRILQFAVVLLPVLVASSSLISTGSNNPTVKLPQGTFNGVTLHPDGYNRSINAFLGIPYAQPPVGDLRLRSPVAVATSSQVFNATAYGPQCFQPALQPAYLPNTPGMSEDCLTLNVFQPVDAPLDQKIPVAVNIHGGAFNTGAAKALNTSSMVSWSDEPFIGVSINYRIGAFGFLPSNLSATEGALNIGLKDQILALQWVQENIESFGGDPDQVTIFGPSAGGHSVGHHLMNIGHPGLFHRVIMEDGAPTARAVPPPTNDLVNQQFNEFLQSAGCANDADSSQIFPCLRALPAAKFANASITLFGRYNPSVRWPFQPVVDGEIIRLRPTEEWESGEWNKVPILTGFATDEGSIFAPLALNTSAGFTDFFQSLIPAFNSSDLDELNALYPDPLTDPSSPYVDTRPIPVGSEYKRATAALGQSAYICNIITTAHFASQSTPPVWLWHWATNVSLVYGASHQ